MRRFAHLFQIGLLLGLLAACGNEPTGSLPAPTSAIAATPPPAPALETLSAPTATTIANLNPTRSTLPALTISPALSTKSALAGSLTSGPDMSRPRAAHSATLLNNGTVLIVGGMERNGAILGSAEIYDPATGKFRPTGALNSKRVGQQATLLANGQVLITGGVGEDILASAELYDPLSGSFSQTGAMLTKRDGHTATLLPDGRVLITGGSTFDSTAQPVQSSTEVYDRATGTFKAAGQMTVPRNAHSATLLANGKVLLVGGSSGRSQTLTIYNSAELYDPVANTFTPTASLGTARHKHSATLLPNGKVVITGGSDARSLGGLYRSIEIYDPVAATFSSGGNMLTARYKHPAAVTLLQNGKILLAGGNQRAEVYDPQTTTSSAISGDFDTARFFSTTTRLPDGQVLIAGGYDSGTGGNGPISTAHTWLYQP